MRRRLAVLVGVESPDKTGRILLEVGAVQHGADVPLCALVIVAQRGLLLVVARALLPATVVRGVGVDADSF